jgi:hypothetical protein
MKIERQSQEVYLTIKDCRMHMDKPGLILPDGAVVNPEVQIVDDEGNVYTLHSGKYGISPVGLNGDLWRFPVQVTRGD